MRPFNKTIILLATALAIAVASGGAYAFFFITMKAKTQATADLLVTIDDLSGKETRINSSLMTLKSEKDNIEKLSAYFIKEGDIVVFAKKLEDLGPQSGTELTIEALDPGVTEKAIPYLGFRIMATGKFVDLEKLLVLLENFPGMFQWSTIRLTVASAVAPVAGPQASTTAQKTSTTPDWSMEASLTALNFIK